MSVINLVFLRDAATTQSNFKSGFAAGEAVAQGCSAGSGISVINSYKLAQMVQRDYNCEDAIELLSALFAEEQPDFSELPISENMDVSFELGALGAFALYDNPECISGDLKTQVLEFAYSDN